MAFSHTRHRKMAANANVTKCNTLPVLHNINCCTVYYRNINNIYIYIYIIIYHIYTYIYIYFHNMKPYDRFPHHTFTTHHILYVLYIQYTCTHTVQAVRMYRTYILYVRMCIHMHTVHTHAHSTYKHTLIKLAVQFDHVVLLAGESVDPLNIQPILLHQLNTADQKEREGVAFCGDAGQLRAKVTLLWSSLFGLLGAFSPGGMGDVSWCVCVCVCVCVWYVCGVCMYVIWMGGCVHGP